MTFNTLLYRNANLGNRLDGAYPNGDAPTLSGVSSVTVGASTITINGAGFGTKAQAAPVLWDRGTEAYENGVKNIYRETLVDGAAIVDNAVEANELYYNADTIKLNLTTRALRHANSTGHYINTAVSGQGFVEAPMCAGGKAVSVPAHNQHYMSWWVKYKYDFQQLHSFDYTGQVGTFITTDLIADPDSVGEQVTLNNGETAYILRDTGAEICIYTPNSRLRMNELANTTVTGVTSGATVTITDKGAYTDNHSGPEKVCRVWSSNDGSTGFRFTWERVKIDTVGDGAKQSTYGDINLAPNAVPNQWSLMELMVDLDAETVTAACNGKVLTTVSTIGYNGQGGVWDKTKGLYLAAIGLQPIRILHQTIEFSDIYLDHEFKRVYIGDAPTWGACTKWELQRTTQWNTGEIKFELNQGSLPDLATNTAYIYKVDGAYPDDADVGFAIGGVQ